MRLPKTRRLCSEGGRMRRMTKNIEIYHSQNHLNMNDVNRSDVNESLLFCNPLNLLSYKPEVCSSFKEIYRVSNVWSWFISWRNFNKRQSSCGSQKFFLQFHSRISPFVVDLIPYDACRLLIPTEEFYRSFELCVTNKDIKFLCFHSSLSVGVSIFHVLARLRMNKSVSFC